MVDEYAAQWLPSKRDKHVKSLGVSGKALCLIYAG